MNQITIRSISIEGFKSYIAPTAFKFNNTGLHLIKGLNGEGKTTLFSALTWCLYKVNLNNTSNTKVPTWKWRRDKTWQGTRVQVVFGIGRYKYLVARHIDFKGTTKGIDPNDSLLIFKKEKTDKTPITAADIINDELYKSDQQAYLDKLLGIDSKTFLNSVLFGQRMARLMDSKDADKRDLFERLFDVDFIDTIRETAIKKQFEANNILSQLNTEQSIAVNAHNLLLKSIENANNILSEFATNRKERLAAIRGQHVSAKEQLDVLLLKLHKAEKRAAKSGAGDILQTLLETVDEKREAFFNAKEELGTVRRDIINREGNIKIHCGIADTAKVQLATVSTECPYCGSDLPESKIKATKKAIRDRVIEETAIVESLDSALQNLKRNEVAYTQKMNVLHEAFITASDEYETAKANAAISGDRDELNILNQDHQLLLARIANLVEAYTTEKERTAPTVDIAGLQAELADLEEKLPKYAKAIRIKTKYLERIGWWISKAFGSGGLKAYIFSASLNKLNQNLAIYTQQFGYSITFSVNLNKASKPFEAKVTLDGQHEVDYSELSGGQKQRIDICIAFAMFDTIAVKTSFNLIIFDEVAEGLDAEAQELLDMILRLKSQDKAVYIISHNNQMDLSSAIEIEIAGGLNGTTTIN